MQQHYDFDGFLERNPTFESRIEALTSRILTPDPKGIVLWSMNPNRAYRLSELYHQAREFSGMGRFPVSLAPVWGYCERRNQEGEIVEGSLTSIGAVVRQLLEIEPYRIVSAYQKTDAGLYLGDPIVAKATSLVNELSHNDIKYSSMWRLFSSASKSSEAKYRRGYAVYRIIKHLVENSGKRFTCLDLINETELDDMVVSLVLNSLGFSGITDYKSPDRDIKGKKARGWLEYKANSNLFFADEQEIYNQIKEIKPYFHTKGCLLSIIKSIKDNPEDIECNRLADELGIHQSNVSKCLSLLSRLGYLESEFKAGEIHSIAMDNRLTNLVWERLLYPVELAADLRCEEVFDEYEFYYYHPERRLEDIQNQLNIYNNERSQIGPRGGEEIRDLILISLVDGQKKISHILEEVNQRSERRIGSGAIFWQLENLIQEGSARKTKRGWYERA